MNFEERIIKFNRNHHHSYMALIVSFEYVICNSFISSIHHDEKRAIKLIYWLTLGDLFGCVG